MTKIIQKLQCACGGTRNLAIENGSSVCGKCRLKKALESRAAAPSLIKIMFKGKEII